MSKFIKRVLRGTAAVGALAAAGSWAMAPRTTEPKTSSFWHLLQNWRYAHRGLYDAAAGVPENSHAAFVAAANAGFGVELDVHLTADNQLVVIHDSNLTRMCGVARMVEDCPLSELRGYRLQQTDEGIPTFEEVLNIFEGREEGAAPLIVELKVAHDNAAALTQAAMEVLDAHNVPYCIESFDPRVLAWLRINRPEVVRIQLVEDLLTNVAFAHLGMAKRLAFTLFFQNSMGRPDFMAIRFDDYQKPQALWAKKVLGMKFITWTIRSAEDMAVAEAEGMPVIFEGFVPDPHAQIVAFVGSLNLN